MTSHLPLVSVAIATYNGDKFLRKQLDSIYHQTYKNIEVVVTDDGSTDKTLKILEEYHQNYGLRYFSNPTNLGVLRNFERAISLCNGEYIALSDQDDIWKPEKIEVQLQEIGEYSLIYAPALEVIDEQDKLAYTHHDSHLIERIGTGKPTHRLIAFNWVTSHQIVFKRELLQVALPIPKHQLCHDAWLALAASKLNGIKFLNRGLMYYRQHSTSVTYSSYEASRIKKNKFLKFFLDSETKQIKRKKFLLEIDRLNDLLNHSLFDEADQRFIQALIEYYRNRFDSVLHWQSFLFAIKNAPLFFHNQTPIDQIKFIGTALIEPT